ncbi:hypothetical protein FOL47_000657 [Perkinsus chesapeaki]|uniref:Uncharacterized protein n=1 Tax=Perkinsus chesapeaki TaxID=330153 RepID=A0A7J6ML71_PERCH|nr:hypothetical protein FOL47_000657 [Perkinsus chesapeaki]
MSARRLERVILATEFGFRSIKLLELRARTSCRVADDFIQRFLPSFKYHNVGLEFKYTTLDEVKDGKRKQQQEEDANKVEGDESSKLPESFNRDEDVLIIDFSSFSREKDGSSDGAEGDKMTRKRQRLFNSSGSGQVPVSRENRDDRFERKVKRRLEDEIDKRIRDGLKDAEYQKEVSKAVEELRVKAHAKMLQEVESEKVLIKKDFDRKLEESKTAALQKDIKDHEGCKLAPKASKDSEAEARRVG